MKLRKFTSGLDSIGIMTSALCALHCLLLPLLAIVLPFSGLAFLADPMIDKLMIGAALLVGTLSLGISWFRHHHRLLPLLLFTGGFCLIVIVHIFPGHVHSLSAGIASQHIRVTAGHLPHSGITHAFLMATAGLAMAAAHFLNWRYSRKDHFPNRRGPVKLPVKSKRTNQGARQMLIF